MDADANMVVNMDADANMVVNGWMRMQTWL
jgi:hypothetical protein